MLQGYGPVMQAFLGTLFTWGLTAAGAALVIFIKGTKVSIFITLKLTRFIHNIRILEKTPGY